MSAASSLSASPALDRARLLLPLPGDDPGGADVRYDGTYDAILEARREDDASLPQREWKRRLKLADWAAVKRLATEALAGRSKDLQVAAWLAEALYMLHGPAGLAQGLEVMADLVREHWPHLHPRPEGEDMEQRLAIVDWADDKLALRLRSVAITAGPTREAAAYAYQEWQAMLHRENFERQGKGGGKGGGDPQGATRAQIETAWASTDTAFLRQLHGDLGLVTAAADRLEAALGGQVPDLPAPQLPALRRTVEEIRQLVARVRPEAAGPEAPPSPAAGEETEAAEAEASGEQTMPEGARPSAEGAPLRGAALGPIKTRSDAYRRLAEVADFLIRTEPHSPAGYLARKAARWGETPLPDLLQELVKDPGNLHAIYSLLDIVEEDEPASR